MQSSSLQFLVDIKSKTLIVLLTAMFPHVLYVFRGDYINVLNASVQFIHVISIIEYQRLGSCYRSEMAAQINFVGLVHQINLKTEGREFINDVFRRRG